MTILSGQDDIYSIARPYLQALASINFQAAHRRLNQFRDKTRKCSSYLNWKVHEFIQGAHINRQFRLPILCLANAAHFSQLCETFRIELQSEVEVYTCMLLRQVAMAVTPTSVCTRVRTRMTWEQRATMGTRSTRRRTGKCCERMTHESVDLISQQCFPCSIWTAIRALNNSYISSR